MGIAGPLLALAGVVIGGALSYLFSTLGENRRERWALGREWRDRKIHSYTRFVGDVKRIRVLAQRIAAHVGLDEQAFPLPRESGVEQLADANTARSESYEMVALLGSPEVVEAARRLNRCVWRLDWFARGLLDDTDTTGWSAAMRKYHQAIDDFLRHARLDVGVAGEFVPRETEASERERYELDKELELRTQDGAPDA